MDYTSLIKEVNIPELVKALTCGNDGKLPCHNNECPYWVDQWHGIGLCNVIKKDAAAAAAIEALMDAEKTYLAELAQCHENLRRAAETRRERDERIEALQAEVEELKRVNVELFEDLPKYGDKILHWVSVEDELPPPNKTVLACKIWGDVNGEPHKVITMDSFTISPSDSVIAWMPLPEPPQEVQK